jgi:hypothetical protein
MHRNQINPFWKNIRTPNCPGNKMLLQSAFQASKNHRYKTGTCGVSGIPSGKGTG